jgi:hypothetical protein
VIRAVRVRAPLAGSIVQHNAVRIP